MPHTPNKLISLISSGALVWCSYVNSVLRLLAKNPLSTFCSSIRQRHFRMALPYIVRCSSNANGPVIIIRHTYVPLEIKGGSSSSRVDLPWGVGKMSYNILRRGGAEGDLAVMLRYFAAWACATRVSNRMRHACYSPYISGSAMKAYWHK